MLKAKAQHGQRNRGWGGGGAVGVIFLTEISKHISIAFAAQSTSRIVHYLEVSPSPPKVNLLPTSMRDSGNTSYK